MLLTSPLGRGEAGSTERPRDLCEVTWPVNGGAFALRPVRDGVPRCVVVAHGFVPGPTAQQGGTVGQGEQAHYMGPPRSMSPLEAAE